MNRSYLSIRALYMSRYGFPTVDDVETYSVSEQKETFFCGSCAWCISSKNRHHGTAASARSEVTRTLRSHITIQSGYRRVTKNDQELVEEFLKSTRFVKFVTVRIWK